MQRKFKTIHGEIHHGWGESALDWARLSHFRPLDSPGYLGRVNSLHTANPPGKIGPPSSLLSPWENYFPYLTHTASGQVIFARVHVSCFFGRNFNGPAYDCASEAGISPQELSGSASDVFLDWNNGLVGCLSHANSNWPSFLQVVPTIHSWTTMPNNSKSKYPLTHDPPYAHPESTPF